MSSRLDKSWFSEPVARYAVDHSEPPDDIQRRLIAETAERTGRWSGMQISQDQAVFMAMVVQLTGAERVVEIGTFTGYSALAMARALPEHGRLLCCDVSEEWTSIGRRYWAEAGVDHKIELRLGPALETLSSLEASAQFDVAFIDADKTNYAAYYEALLPRLRSGGLIMVDNTLWDGRVIDPSVDDDDTRAIRAFNDMVVEDARVTCVLTTIGDGLTLARKK